MPGSVPGMKNVPVNKTSPCPRGIALPAGEDGQ